MNKWLKNAEAAELLGVDERTIKRWMTKADTREALLAVRHGKQWRIPYPADTEAWANDTRWRLKKCGIRLEPTWKRDLRQMAQNDSRFYLESYRLWVAAYAKALGRGRITQKAREGINVLRNAAIEILKTLPDSELSVEKIKSRIAALIRDRGLPLKSVMRHWPTTHHFNLVRTAKTVEELEAFRCSLDWAQASRDNKRRGKNPTAENLCPSLHKNFVEHINDTREKVPGTVIKNPTSDQIRNVVQTSVQNAIWGKKASDITLDFRQPQDGLALRTFRKRYPRKRTRKIEAAIYGTLENIPGTAADAGSCPETG